MKKFIEKIKNVNIYQNRRIFYIVPLVIILVMLICGLVYQLTDAHQYFANISIDFQGGTILTVDFVDSKANSADYDANLAKIKQVVESHDIKVSLDQSSGDSAIIVQYTNWVSGQEGTDSDADQMSTLNQTIASELYALSDSNGISAIKDNGITYSTIGNESSKTLLRTSAIAVAVALAFILLYIIIRFDASSGLAAVIALLHDVVIMLSLSVIFYVELGDSIVAGLITIVAYSINNTIVVFDRIRSNVKPLKKKGEKIIFEDVINGAIKATFKRTVYTTLTTLVVMIILVAIGVASIQTFGLPIIFGLIAGFYSSVFIAAPLWGDLKKQGEAIKLRIKNKKFEKNRKKA